MAKPLPITKGKAVDKKDSFSLPFAFEFSYFHITLSYVNVLSPQKQSGDSSSRWSVSWYWKKFRSDVRDCYCTVPKSLGAANARFLRLRYSWQMCGTETCIWGVTNENECTSCKKLEDTAIYAIKWIKSKQIYMTTMKGDFLWGYFLFLLSPDGLHDPIWNGRNAEVDSIQLTIVETQIAVAILVRYPHQWPGTANSQLAK